MAPHRFWYQSAAPIGNLPNYRAALARHAADACAAGVEVRFNGVREERYAGRLPAEIHRYPYARLVLQEDSIGFGLQAEGEGFDAFIIGSFSEPFLVETRSLLRIPVVSLAETALFTACSLGDQFGLVTLAPGYARRLRGVVRRHGLEARCRDVVPLRRSHDESSIDAAFSDPGMVIDDFAAAAEVLVAGGADVVVPAEGLLNELLRGAGIREVAGAPVLDCVGASLLQAEMMVNLRTRLGIGVSRRWTYARPPDDLLRDLLAGRNTQ